MSDFVAIDVETANPDFSSICQIGIVAFQDGKIVHQWESLINPHDDFDEVNVQIHGINETAVQGAPSISDAYGVIRKWLENAVVATYTSFDRASINSALTANGLAPFQCEWLDVARVARRAWPQYAQSGYRLVNVANDLGIVFSQHNALDDARAAGEILVQAVNATSISVEDWKTRVTLALNGQPSTSKVGRAGNPDGPLFGDVAVFTGALSLPRKQAADMAAQLGCEIKDSISKSVTILIVGDQDIQRLAGKSKSSKHLKAEEAIRQGQPIRIIGESDFKKLIGT